jgi:hypothetical protein
MPQKRPINAGTPAAVPQTVRERGRKPLPGALKAIAGLVVVAIAFLVAALVAGGGSENTAGHGAVPAEAGEAPAVAASSNTTRISGPDPASLAANIALTVFPSTTPAQRPKSVSLVGEDSWENAVSGAVLMAHPIRAPLLIASASGTPEATNVALAKLQPHGNLLKKKGNLSRKGAPYYVLGAIATPPSGIAARTGETDGAAQAASLEVVRTAIFREEPKHIVVASEDSPAFAAPAAAWAARSGDPVLFSRRDELPAATAKMLRLNRRVPVYVLGPTSVVAPSVLREIAEIDPHVKRVAGETPAENAIAFARYADGSFGWNVNDPGHGFVVARSDEPLNAALAAPLSASGTWGPLLLTESADKLPRAVREYLLDVKPGYTTNPTRAFYNHVWIIGGEEEIGAGEQAEINQLAELAKVGREP